MKKIIKKTLKNKYFLTGLLTPIILVSLTTYGVWSGIKHLEERDARNFNDGLEVGRFLQLNEDAENTQLEIQAKKEASKDTLLKNLARLESMNGTKRKVLDTNNKYSLGLYHFQATSVKDMYRRYYKKNISITEAVNIANDDELATKLAHDAIFIHKEYFHWKISLCKLGMITSGCLSQKQINNLFAKK